MQFQQTFPIAIIDEDFDAKTAAGRGMPSSRRRSRRRASALVAGLSYDDAHRLAEIFNTKSCWLVSVDGAEAATTQWERLEAMLAAKRKRNDRLPIFLFGDERTAEAVPASVLKHAKAFMRLFEDSPEFLARAISRSAELYLERLAPPMFKALMDYAARKLFLAHPRARRRRRVQEERGRAALLSVPRREHAALGRLGVGGRARLAARPHRARRSRGRVLPLGGAARVEVSPAARRASSPGRRPSSRRDPRARS